MMTKHPYPAGTYVEKCNSEPGDGHPDGTPAVVTRCMNPGKPLDGTYGYFVKFDGFPVPVFIRGDRIKPRL